MQDKEGDLPVYKGSKGLTKKFKDATPENLRGAMQPWGWVTRNNAYSYAIGEMLRMYPECVQHVSDEMAKRRVGPRNVDQFFEGRNGSYSLAIAKFPAEVLISKIDGDARLAYDTAYLEFFSDIYSKLEKFEVASCASMWGPIESRLVHTIYDIINIAMSEAGVYAAQAMATDDPKGWGKTKDVYETMKLLAEHGNLVRNAMARLGWWLDNWPQMSAEIESEFETIRSFDSYMQRVIEQTCSNMVPKAPTIRSYLLDDPRNGPNGKNVYRKSDSYVALSMGNSPIKPGSRTKMRLSDDPKRRKTEIARDLSVDLSFNTPYAAAWFTGNNCSEPHFLDRYPYEGYAYAKVKTARIYPKIHTIVNNAFKKILSPLALGSTHTTIYAIRGNTGVLYNLYRDVMIESYHGFIRSTSSSRSAKAFAEMAPSYTTAHLQPIPEGSAEPDLVSTPLLENIVQAKIKAQFTE